MNNLLAAGRAAGGWDGEPDEPLRPLADLCSVQPGAALKEASFLCLVVSGSINLLPCFAPQAFYESFACYQGLFFFAELAPCAIYQFCTMYEMGEPGARGPGGNSQPSCRRPCGADGHGADGTGPTGSSRATCL